ncbi:MAG: hypothetical protein JWR14_2890 [Caballeronia sp.]|jgi:hypothetical protein|nr:hypothetical protein [Caballeronia sp.]
MAYTRWANSLTAKFTCIHPTSPEGRRIIASVRGNFKKIISARCSFEIVDSDS